MATRPAHPQPADGGAVIGDRAFAIVGVFVVGLLVVGLVSALLGAIVPHRGGTTPSAPGAVATSSPTAPPDGRAFLAAVSRPAAPIELTDPAGRPFSLAALRGAPTLVFFGYTHCPDVCPATIGIVGKALATAGGNARAVFVSVDPERDTTAWLSEYSQYLPTGFTAVTGTPAQIKATANAWGVRYAKVAGATPDTYSMSHTADVFIIDAAGQLRGSFPFGTTTDQMVATLRVLEAEGAAPQGSAGAAASPVVTPAPSVAPSAIPGSSPSTSSSVVAGSLQPTIVSSAVWAGGHSPVILALAGPIGPIADPGLVVTAQLETPDRQPVGDPVTAVAVRPPYENRVLYVPTVDIPAPGAWWLSLSTTVAGAPMSGTVALTALDPGSSAALGSPAPAARTPTLADVGGDHWAVSTDPAPDERLYQQSTADALAAHTPFVLVVDSVRFRVSPQCGKAVILARSLIDRWPTAAFIHLEPYTYAVVSETPVLEGEISDPTLNDVATAWGVGGAPWGSRYMPWVFVVDGNGVVRAKYQGIVGSDDLDVILALVAQGA